VGHFLLAYPQSQVQDAEPIGFFSDQIVSTKLMIHDSDRETLVTDTLRFEQYDLLHQDQEVADPSVSKDLEIRYPLPRLHQISRRFTDEYDLRAPAQSLVTISQKWAWFKTTRSVRCPKIVRLRNKRQCLVQQLQINLRVDLSEDCISRYQLSWLLDYYLCVPLD
jgi:hypothetical protein